MQMRCLIWFLTVLCAVCLAVTTHWQGQDIVTGQDISEYAEPSVLTPLQHQHHEAALTDVTLLYRICSSRPQRILPTHGSRSKRALTPTFNLIWYIVKPLHSYFDNRCRQESAPFRMSSTCDYYVFALRHIIR